MKDQLLVNEIYGPVAQGEGKSAGKMTSFLRLATCNLACVFCDTPYTWSWIGTRFRHPLKFSKSDEIHIRSSAEIKTHLDSLGIKAVVMSGGEPFLQQVELLPLLRDLKADGYWVEVETNGTIEPLAEFLELVDQINCSPKTSNSGPDNRPSMVERPRALKVLTSSFKTNLKFVVSSEHDMPEILALIEKYRAREIYLMPEGRTRQEQLERQDTVMELCHKHSFHFSPRIHVLQHNDKRGV